MLTAGKKAPEFTLPDQDGTSVSLTDFAGKWVLLYFYPKDDTPGCTVEACGFRDNLPKFKKSGVTVLGISVDSVRKHKNFATKYGLPFTLLADTEKKVVELYGVWAEKKMMGHTYMGILRTSFLIDPVGMIAKVYEQVKPEEHPEEVLGDIQNLVTK